jgi:hypothetical protein
MADVTFIERSVVQVNGVDLDDLIISRVREVDAARPRPSTP